MTQQWDAATYDRVADAQTRWGANVLDRLHLPDGARVLDAGCGTGRVTELLLEGFNPVVFCRFIDTAEYVAEHLARHLGPEYAVAAVRSVASTSA